MKKTKDDKGIQLARKYGLRLGTLKFTMYWDFEDGYKPDEIKHKYSDTIEGSGDPIYRSIQRYYYSWKKAQNILKTNKP